MAPTVTRSGWEPPPIKVASPRPIWKKLPIDQLEAELEPIFVYFKQSRQSGEAFGDFCHRVGFAALRQFVTTYEATTPRVTKTRHRITVQPDLYARLQTAATAQGKQVSQLATEAIAAYLAGEAP
ncbi:hypothetical protein [Neosynechococcus sphagnicola]|uniref:hypothetical protein n=1 Tax=Neosynechococcus sphagnicola TaxID=1501145 RepID=UPI0030840F2D